MNRRGYPDPFSIFNMVHPFSGFEYPFGMGLGALEWVFWVFGYFWRSPILMATFSFKHICRTYCKLIDCHTVRTYHLNC